jgi:glc operon protein GlcG
VTIASMESASDLDAVRALAIVQAVAAAAAGPVSVVVSDDHGEPVASLRMDGAALDTYENARRKAYTAARSDQLTTRALADKVRSSPSELASFDPSFSFFMGGVAVIADGRRVGAVGVSGLPGPDDEAVAIAAIAAAGFDAP